VQLTGLLVLFQTLGAAALSGALRSAASRRMGIHWSRLLVPTRNFIRFKTGGRQALIFSGSCRNGMIVRLEKISFDCFRLERIQNSGA